MSRDTNSKTNTNDKSSASSTSEHKIYKGKNIDEFGNRIKKINKEESVRNYRNVSRLPIDISTNKTLTSHKQTFKLHYKDEVRGFFHTTNYAVQFEVTKHTSYLVHNDKKYYLREFHFHNPSEHSIDGVFYPMECHFVNVSDDGSAFVIGLLFKFGDKNAFFAENAFDEKDFGKEISLPLSLLNNINHNPYYHFLGSLTTPPFTPNLIWTLFNCDDVRTIGLTVTKHNYKKFLKLFQNNRIPINKYTDNRYTQPLQNNFLAITKITSKK